MDLDDWLVRYGARRDAGITFSGEMGDVVPDLEEMVETGRVAIDFRRQAARFEYIQPQIVDVAVQDVRARVLRRDRIPDSTSQSRVVALVRLRT